MIALGVEGPRLKHEMPNVEAILDRNEPRAIGYRHAEVGMTYVSLNHDNSDLNSIMPSCGTHDRAGPKSIVQTSVDVGRYWTVL